MDTLMANLDKALEIVQRDFENTSPKDESYNDVVRAYSELVKAKDLMLKNDLATKESESKIAATTAETLMKERELEFKDRELDFRIDEAQMRGNAMVAENDLKFEELELKRQQFEFEKLRYGDQLKDLLRSVAAVAAVGAFDHALKTSYLDHSFELNETTILRKSAADGLREALKPSNMSASIRKLVKL